MGRNLHYYKPSQRKTGDLWVKEFTNPKTRQRQPYTIYGGKLAGLLTQSLCREQFFQSLASLYPRLMGTGVKIVGQFHDEIVLEWDPTCSIGLATAEGRLEQAMTTTNLRGFPLAAEIKHDHRYIK